MNSQKQLKQAGGTVGDGLLMEINTSKKIQLVTVFICF